MSEWVIRKKNDRFFSAFKTIHNSFRMASTVLILVRIYPDLGGNYIPGYVAIFPVLTCRCGRLIRYVNWLKEDWIGR